MSVARQEMDVDAYHTIAVIQGALGAKVSCSFGFS